MKGIFVFFLIIIFRGAICNAQQALSTIGGEITAAGGNVKTGKIF